jgi:hypothetical protein
VAHHLVDADAAGMPESAVPQRAGPAHIASHVTGCHGVTYTTRGSHVEQDAMALCIRHNVLGITYEGTQQTRVGNEVDDMANIVFLSLRALRR